MLYARPMAVTLGENRSDSQGNKAKNAEWQKSRDEGGSVCEGTRGFNKQTGGF